MTLEILEIQGYIYALYCTHMESYTETLFSWAAETIVALTVRGRLSWLLPLAHPAGMHGCHPHAPALPEVTTELASLHDYTLLALFT